MSKLISLWLTMVPYPPGLTPEFDPEWFEDERSREIVIRTLQSRQCSLPYLSRKPELKEIVEFEKEILEILKGLRNDINTNN